MPIQTDYYNIYTTGSVDTYGSLYQGTSLKKNNDDGAGSFNFLINMKLTKGTTYYIKVKGFNYEKTGNFSLRIESDFVNQLQKLHDLAKAYSGAGANSVKLTMEFIRRGKYSGNYMDLDFWGLAAGDVDQGFVSYVQSNNTEIYDFFTIPTGADYYWYRTNGEVIDIPHLAATYNIYQFDTFGAIGSAILPESWIDNLGGWAGDLRSIIPFVMRDVGYSTDYNTIYAETMSQIGASIGESYFTMPDLLADVDAYNLFNSVNVNSLKETFNAYYGSTVSTRYTDFTNGWTYQSIFDLTKNMMTNSVVNSSQVWPLKKVDNQGVKTSEGLSLTDNQMNAICYAFADYLWERIAMEG